MYGVVKWYNVKQGYGFIKTDNGKEYFIHKSEIPFWSIFLNKGDKVEFLIKATKKGPIAKDLKLV
jgi:CspA family cold shock protein